MEGGGGKMGEDTGMFDVRGLLGLDRLVEVVDIGANPIDGPPPYQPLLDGDMCRVTGFEPQIGVMGAKGARAVAGNREVYLPYAIGDGGVHTLHVCRASGMSGLLEPDVRSMEVFDPMHKWGEVIGKQEVHTRRLDDVLEVDVIDYLKIDIQGGELEVFKGGRKKLAGTAFIHTEVSFVTLYRNQVGIGEVDVELRKQGFIPHCFAGIKKWLISGGVKSGERVGDWNQLLEADIVYVRDFMYLGKLTDGQLKMMALIGHYCYRSYDLAARCVRELEARGAVGYGARAEYVGMVGKG